MEENIRALMPRSNQSRGKLSRRTASRGGGGGLLKKKAQSLYPREVLYPVIAVSSLGLPRGDKRNACH